MFCVHVARVRVDAGPSARDARILVHLDAKAVAGSVTERVAQAVTGERIAGRLVDRKPRSARRHGRNRLFVRIEHRSVDLASAGARRADRDRPGEVDAV